MTDKIKDNPLEELFTDSISQVEPGALADVLRPYLRINRETKKVLFMAEGMKLTANNKIILFLLAHKAMYLHGVTESETLPPKEIKAELGKNIPAGTIDAALKHLSAKGPLQNENSKYYVPDFNFQQVVEIFEKIKK